MCEHKLHTISLITKDMQNLDILLENTDLSAISAIDREKAVSLIATKQRIQYIINARLGDVSL